MSSKQRDRGRILTPDGLSRLQQAIRAWELEHEVRCTQERIRELTSAVKEGGLDPGTIRKILKAKDGVDPESIRCLFTTFGLQLAEADLVSSSRLQIQADPNFVGREGAIADLNTLVNRGAKVIVIQARGGVGKTTLARKYLQQEFGSFLEFPIAKETKDIASIESLIEEKLRQLGEEPGREFFVSLDRFKRKLQDERMGILIDNLEPALDSAGKFIEPHRRYVELLRVLTDPVVQSVTFITSRERLRESSVTVEHYMLRSLDIEAWEQFFQSRNLATDIPTFAALHNAYGGNAKAMDIIRGAILEDYSRDVAAYWQANQNDLFIERDLEDLVTQQFERLQQIDADAYNLLCRMGCYRHQDVPTVPIEGLLCLLWDVPGSRQRRVVKSLQDRSLMEFEDGEYWLHPVIRGDAIGRLKASEDWKPANFRVARFWNNSVEVVESVEDALMAFEASYHYLEISDFEQAGITLITRRFTEASKVAEPEPLGRSLCRLGLLQQLTPTINLLVSSVKSRYILSELYNILGILNWLLGCIHEAIKFHEMASCIASESPELPAYVSENGIPHWDPREIELSATFRIGMCKMELWEIEEAIKIFEDRIPRCFHEPNNVYKRHLSGSHFGLAFLHSVSNYSQKANYFIELVSLEVEKVQLLSWGTGFRFIYLGLAYSNLKSYRKAFVMYQKAVSYAEKSHYIQVKAKAQYCLATLYREWCDYEAAFLCCLDSIELLKAIAAKCDLAEAYYQIGLTYQAVDEIEKSNESFQEAIRLFAEMEAPKQVERVRRSMLTGTND